jgi:acetyl-CoA acetyltransferase
MANMARMAPNFATDLALGGATPIAMVQHAVMAIESGMANTVMCVHARKRGTPDPTPGHPIRHGDEHWEEPWGHFSAVANHAFAAQRHMYEFGTTSEDLAHVAVATRKHACLNNNATMRKPMTIADHQASRGDRHQRGARTGFSQAARRDSWHGPAPSAFQFDGRAHTHHPWRQEIIGAGLPDGRTCPQGREFRRDL